MKSNNRDLIAYWFTSFFASFFLISCGTTSSVKLSSAGPDENIVFTLQDARPAKQKHSYNEVDTNGNNMFFGDDNLSPGAAQLLKIELPKRLGTELTGRTVVLTDFVVNVYEPAVSVDRAGIHNSAATVPNGYAVEPLAELLIVAIEGMKSEKNVIVQISGNVENSAFSGSLSENFQGRVTEGNIKDTVDKVLEDISGQIKSIITAKK